MSKNTKTHTIRRDIDHDAPIISTGNGFKLKTKVVEPGEEHNELVAVLDAPVVVSPVPALAETSKLAEGDLKFEPKDDKVKADDKSKPEDKNKDDKSKKPN